MTLEELVALPCAPNSLLDAAPDWMVGSFGRRSITFYTGASDVSTQVYWLQSRGLSADLRIASWRRSPRGHSSLAEYDARELAVLAEAEGGVASASWNGETMRWFGWTSFQVHDKWPEPGRLRRVGDCIVEFAPSGAYVEDWRLLKSKPGPLIGLRLLDERDLETGDILHRGGGLIVCGDHAALVRGRPKPLPTCSRLAELTHDRTSQDPIWHRIFSFEASYAIRRESGCFEIVLSTSPHRERQVLTISSNFDFDPATKLVTQRVLEGEALVERRFTIETLEPYVDFSCATAANPEANEWLCREAVTLLAAAHD